MAGELPKDWKKHTDAMIQAANDAGDKMATRKASQNMIAALAPVLPEFVGGSADLTGSNLTSCSAFEHVSGNKPGIIFLMVYVSFVWQRL